MDSVNSKYTLRLLTSAAVALPLIWAYQAPPLPAFFSQWLSDLLWSVVVFVSFAGTARARFSLRHHHIIWANRTANRGWFKAHWPVIALWSLLAASVLSQACFVLTPAFSALPAAFNLLLAGLTTIMVLGRDTNRDFLRRWMVAFLYAVLLAAVFNSGVALVQTIAPNWTNDSWIASVAATPRRLAEHGVDRVGGNLRQPNQLGTLMIWGLLAATCLLRQRAALWLAVSLPLLATLFATGSRVGVLSLLLIVGVALLRSRRVRQWPRAMWLAVGLMALMLLWFAASAFTRATAEPALAQRLALWLDVWTLIQQSPWIGVGWGQLNFAWTLTPLPSRAPDVFDHAHSLPLNLAAELGLPLALSVLALLALTLWRARRALHSRDGATALLMLATILLHSLFEYPLWFAYFLLPSAFLLAWVVSSAAADETGDAGTESRAPTKRWMIAGSSMATLVAVGCIAASVYAWNEYRKITAIYGQTANADALRVAVSDARKSPLYGQFGDYAAIMLAGDRAAFSWFARPIRQVLDERLLTAYAQALMRAGEMNKAAYVVARAREFPPQPVFAELPVIVPSTAASAPLTSRDFRR